MNLTRRKFIQFAGMICVAPVFNKIDGLVTANVDSCVPDIVPSSDSLEWDNSGFNPIEVFRRVAKKLIADVHLPVSRKYYPIVGDSSFNEASVKQLT